LPAFVSAYFSTARTRNTIAAIKQFRRKLRPDGWDCHFPADVKDHAPQGFPLERRYYTQNRSGWSGEILERRQDGDAPS
jgi:hypothetical protein